MGGNRLNLMTQGLVLWLNYLHTRLNNHRSCQPYSSCGGWHLSFTWPRTSKWSIISDIKNDKWWLFLHLLLGVCPTTVSTVVPVPSPGAPSTVTAPTRVTREPPAIPVSRVHFPSLAPVLTSLSVSLSLLCARGSLYVQAGLGIDSPDFGHPGVSSWF